MSARYECFDVMVIGSGIAGLSAAIRARERGASVCVISKEPLLEECNTFYAQGGIVARGVEDGPDILARDIMTAGSHSCRDEAVKIVSEEGPGEVVSFLAGELGVPFCKNDDGSWDFTREAAHSVRRILHVKDTTGRSIEEALLAKARATDGIHLFPGCMAIDLITNTHHSLDPQQRYESPHCLGAYVFLESTGEIVPFFASSTILATGGVGSLYLHTSNPPCATGDGVAMASRAGVPILNAEFVQFHPTVLYHRDVKRFLISETLRGEGARLMNKKGDYFMRRYHPALKELAPRDEVARAIYLEMEQSDASYVLLDTTSMKVDPEKRFPAIYAKCRELGMDIKKDPIPVVPAAHYFCGGVKTDGVGKTSIPGLYAIGETACTGVHGANRLASVSLLEGLVFGLRAGEDAVGTCTQSADSVVRSIPDWIPPAGGEAADPMLVYHDLLNVQTIMWDYVGIIRTPKRLDRAVSDLNYLSHRIESFYREATITRKLLELRNVVDCASIIAHSAQANRQSIGCHYVRH
jgi:L-aspartate oxidase